MDAYLDIETTGLSPTRDRITVVGIFLSDALRVIQWVGDEITVHALLKSLDPVTTLYTYNGAGFDLPFLRCQLGVDLAKKLRHRDLMLDCWKRHLYGGFKAVERQLGISRGAEDMDGLEAVNLWHKYQAHGDRNALRRLLDYNREDLLNLKALRDVLGV